jgi:DUF971 family protein
MERRGPAIEPKEIKHEDDFNVSITWGDDRQCRYRAAELRRACPCAQRDISIVGRYALNFRWSDGHETGIYSFRYLRELCETQDQQL